MFSVSMLNPSLQPSSFTHLDDSELFIGIFIIQAALRRTVREPTYWEKLTNGGPELSVPEQPSVFYTDRDYNYCKVWFLGRELELLTLNILAYSLFDLWFGYTTTSILLTYLLDLGVCYLRQELGRVSSLFFYFLRVYLCILFDLIRYC